MPAPSPLDVAVSSVNRLVKERTSYQKELVSQRARVEKVEAEIKAGTGDENAEYVLKQEVCLNPLFSPSPCKHTPCLSLLTPSLQPTRYWACD